MSNYAKADTNAQWFEDKYPGSVMNLSAATTVLVIHTTEGSDWPGYDGGSEAPTYTARPNLRTKRLDWRAHFPDERSARGLVNASGGVETNTLNVVQVELIGTCAKGGPGMFWPDAPEWALRGVADFIADLHTRHGLQLKAPKFEAYPASYGPSNGVRMSGAQWSKFAGVCGHQHVPENVHGDPGAFPIDAVLGYVGELVAPAAKVVAKKPTHHATKTPAVKPAPAPVPVPAPATRGTDIEHAIADLTGKPRWRAKAALRLLLGINPE